MRPASLTRRTFARAVASLGGTAALWPSRVLGAPSNITYASPGAAADEIRTELLHGWLGYRDHAWGHDELLPVSGGSHAFFLPKHSVGLSIVEALDTLYVMGLDAELTAGVDWLRRNLDFDVNGDVQVFEAIIRLVGGLLAGHFATGESFLLDRARDLADRLLPAFTSSPTGIPYRFVDLTSGAVREPVTNLAEAGTNILEFGTLSRLTGRPEYFDASKRAFAAVVKKRSSIDLLGTNINAETGEWTDAADVAPNPPVDSFYEYLWGGWALLADADCRDWYRLLTKAVLRRQAVRPGASLWFQQVDFRSGAALAQQRQSELAAFYAELLAQGGDLADGEAYYDSWTRVVERYGLPPEEVDYVTLDATDAGYQLRPEYANSAFDLWLMTRAEKYRTTGYAHFQQMKQNCRVSGGYTIVTDVRTTPMTLGDLTPAYWFAENMKYLYLMFADSPRFDYGRNYLSTEGKILRGLLPRR
jgi:mannosyl-oligosaccharide alpha-1,2-mannosidase